MLQWVVMPTFVAVTEVSGLCEKERVKHVTLGWDVLSRIYGKLQRLGMLQVRWKSILLAVGSQGMAKSHTTQQTSHNHTKDLLEGN